MFVRSAPTFWQAWATPNKKSDWQTDWNGCVSLCGAFRAGTALEHHAKPDQAFMQSQKLDSNYANRAWTRKIPKCQVWGMFLTESLRVGGHVSRYPWLLELNEELKQFVTSSSKWSRKIGNVVNITENHLSWWTKDFKRRSWWIHALGIVAIGNMFGEHDRVRYVFSPMAKIHGGGGAYVFVSPPSCYW